MRMLQVGLIDEQALADFFAKKPLAQRQRQSVR